MTKHKKPMELNPTGIPEGYSMVMISPSGDIIVAIPENEEHELVSDGAMLAASLAVAYGVKDNADHLIQCIFGDEDGELDVKQHDLEAACSAGMIH